MIAQSDKTDTVSTLCRESGQFPGCDLMIFRTAAMVAIPTTDALCILSSIDAYPGSCIS
jgi:hypothetical protein